MVSTVVSNMPHTTEIRLAKSAYKKFTNYQSGPLFKMLTDMKLKDKVTNKQDKQKSESYYYETIYLGIWFSGVNGIFKTHVKKTIKKAKKLKGVIKNVTADTYQRAGVVTKLWETGYT